MDRLLVCAAYYICANQYHGGQAMKGFAKLSQLAHIGYNPGRSSWETDRGSKERNAAAALLKRRRREIRLQW